MARQAQRNRDNGQSRRRRAAGRKNRASRDEQIRDTMHASIRIDDALLWIHVHARRTELMPTAFEIAGPTLDFLWQQWPCSANTETSQFGINDLLATHRRASVNR